MRSGPFERSTFKGFKLKVLRGPRAYCYVADGVRCVLACLFTFCSRKHVRYLVQRIKIQTASLARISSTSTGGRLDSESAGKRAAAAGETRGACRANKHQRGLYLYFLP